MSGSRTPFVRTGDAGEGVALRRLYGTHVGAALLGVTVGAIQKQLARGSLPGVGPEEPGNPLGVWLADADAVDERSGKDPGASIWILELDPQNARLELSPDKQEALLERYRDALDFAKSEIAAEREARLVAEREVVVREHDEARSRCHESTTPTCFIWGRIFGIRTSRVARRISTDKRQAQ